MRWQDTTFVWIGQPVKWSDALVNEVRAVGALMGRSLAGRVEFWAQLGRDLERTMTRGDVTEVRAKSLAEELQPALVTVNEPEGRARLKAYMRRRIRLRLSRGRRRCGG